MFGALTHGTRLLVALGAAVLPAALLVPQVHAAEIAVLDVLVQDCSEGTPCPELSGVLVELFEANQPTQPDVFQQTSTGVDGIAHFEFPASHIFRIRVSVPGYYSRWYPALEETSGWGYADADNVSVGLGSTTSKTVAIRRIYTIVDVYTYDGTAETDVAGATVGLYDAAGAGDSPVATTTTDGFGSGQFKFSAGTHPEGDYCLRASADGYTTQWYVAGSDPNDFSSCIPLPLTDGAHPATVNIAMSAGAVVSGTVPTITGTAQVGKTLTAVPGAWGPGGVTLAYRWYRDGVALAATSATYAVVAADLGHHLTVRVTGSANGYEPTSKDSAATPAVVKGTFTKKPTPTISGVLHKGHKLTAKVGTWTPTPSGFAYRWFRGTHLITGATGKTYLLRAQDVGKRISVKVTAKLAGYVSTTVVSGKTAPIGP